MISAVLTLAMAVPSVPQQQFPVKSRAKFTVSSTSVPAGGKLSSVITVELDPGWHSYWINPGDTGSPPSIKWDLPEGWKVVRTRFEVPHRIESLGLWSYGYDETFQIAVDFEVPKKAGPVKLGATLDILVCEEQCIPQLLKISETVNVGEAGAATPIVGKFPEWTSAVRGKAVTQGNEVVVTVSGLTLPEAERDGIEAFVETSDVTNNEIPPTVSTKNGEFTFRFKKSSYWSGKVKQFRMLLVAPEKLKLREGYEALVLNVPFGT